MVRFSLAGAALVALTICGSPPTLAQGASPGGSVASSGAAETTTKARPSRAARSTREPTAGQMAARERQKRCGAEWKEAKAGNKTGGLKWPQYWSRCNARLKGNQA